MKISALLVSTATRWIGTARIPAALADAGFAVALLTPRNSLAEKSRHVDSVAYLPDDATITQWVAAFTESVVASAPRIVLPCDDMAFRLLARLARSAAPEMPASVHSNISSLIAYSLGDVTHYDASVGKTRFPGAAQALGVPVPAYAVVDSLAEAESFARACGYPVVCVAWFPEEWLRDPESGYLREHVVDVPWDEPELIEALVAMRRER